MTPESAAPHALPPLPYDVTGLEPAISARTLELHHGRHHRGYVDALNALVAGTERADLSLEDTIAATRGQSACKQIHDQAAQAWNHAFYWQSLKPGGGGEPPASIKPLIAASFGSVRACTDALAAAAAAHFGSGWVWLVIEGGQLGVESTANADQPTVPGRKPLLAIDVWEHAYYLDYQQQRAAHITAVLERLVDWGFAADNLP